MSIDPEPVGAAVGKAEAGGQPRLENQQCVSSGDVAKPATEPSRLSKFVRGLFRYFHLLTYAEPAKIDIALLVCGTIFAIGSGVPFPILGIFLGQVIDDLNAATCDVSASSAPSAELQQSTNQKIIYIVVLGLAQFTGVYVHMTCWNLFGDRLAHRLREKYFRSILRQEVSYFDKLPAGEVSSRLSADIATIKAGTSEKVGTYIGVTSMFVTSYIVAFTKDARLAGMLVCLLPCFILMTWVGGHFVSKYATQASESLAAASSVAMESLSNVMVVHAFRANDRLEAKFATSLEGAKSHGIRKATAAAIQSGLLYFIAFSASGLAYWQASQSIANTVAGITSGISVGSTYTVIFLLVDASLILSQISPFLQFFASAAGALEKLKADMNRRSQIDGTVDGHSNKIGNFRGEVRLDKVHFNYPSRPDVRVIQDVTLEFPAGQHTAIVGLSGSGKSTIAGLVTRLYDPLEGSVSVDGHDIKQVNVRHLRSFVGLVQQDPLLLDRSLLENIALGLVNSSRPEHESLQATLLGTKLEEVAEAVRSGKDLEVAACDAGPEAMEIVRLVQRAASLADAGIFLGSLEFGFGTLVGSNGDLLSGGQKQRVALARALVKDPKILVLDEATSSLDSASEQRIQGAIEKATEGRTVISIAHRLATVRNADKIVVMRNGKVIEQGSHYELLAKDADYAALVRLQSIGSETSSTTTARNSKSLDLDSEKVSHALKVESEAVDAETNLESGGEDKPAETQTKDSKATRPAWKSIKSMSSVSRPYLLWIVIAILAAAVVGGTYSGSAVIFGNTIGALSPCNTPDSIRVAGSFFGLMFFTLAIVEFFANGISWSFFGAVAERVLYKIRILTFRSLFEQDLQWHQSEGRSPSGLLTFLTTDSASIGALTGSIIGTIFSIAINFVAAIILSHVIAWKIAIVCLATVPLMLGAGCLQILVQARFNERHEKAFEKSVSITVEAVNSIKTVAALSLEHEVMNTYRRALAAPRREFTRSSIWSNLWLAIAFSLNNFIYALLYWWGSTLIGRGEYTQTQFFIVLIALLVSAQLWGSVFTLSSEVTRAGRAVGRIFDLIDLGSTKSWNSKALKPRDTEAAIESKGGAPATAGGIPVKFNQVHFSYPARPGREILKGLDIDIRAGQFCALVGPSGAGKSTIVSLLERMYTVSSGSIEVGGLDVTAKSEPLFRDDIGLVPQDSVLFEGTIRFNVALGARPGAPDPTDAEIEQACELANIHETITALPEGYATNCGPNGSQLSGGQRQRLAIARALVRRPRLLLLDESTSALDAESERLLQDGLEKAARGITVVAIAHRLHTIRRADVIFLIEDGRCVDRGSHEELLVRSESYRINVMHQTLDG
ncbi:P-loop containing nucleoside triphosphate hydrolase protein [Microdochium trichocladiopsis]|uniref:P-loop containing nucleoside triphosphate hydrolase protein n=1 Tax=Microdochium trichocladiopsis TaxID=1682393 RepID=A0A9P9C0R7_9PEZI|nr:P-loop containing nucleoside triphosphate hydrolase protein [Microdochium trichocladiopsis]KAH7041384.1 P-loop containing nucleoside triphosphate hydrolase protein [Microdochium trichocladiopsis]